jgi:hypothetical protein
MLKEIHHTLSELHAWAIHPVGFFTIWITIPVVPAICMAWAVRQPSAPRAKEGSINFTPARQVATRRAVAALILLAIFLVFYIAMMLLWTDFASGDNAFFTQITLVGRNISLQIWGSDWGRFWPLGLQDFNVMRHFTNTIVGYFLLPIVQLLIFSLILLVIDDELSVAARAALVSVVLLTPSVRMSFSTLYVPERNVMFLLVCLVLCVKRFGQTQSFVWALAAIICAQTMLYNKEVAFLLLLGFAAGRLVLRCRNAEHAGWDYNKLWDKEARLDLCLAVLAMVFLLFYLGVMDFHNTRYADQFRHPRAEVLLIYFTTDLLAWLLVAVFLGRIYMILCRRTTPVPLWDGLAFGGVGCFLAYLYLGMYQNYYLAPVDLIAVQYVGRFAILSWERIGPWSKVTASVLAFTVLLQDVLHSAVGGIEQKNIIKGEVEIARVIEMRYRSDVGSALRLFFPFASPYQIMEFGAYLNFRGVPVEGAMGNAAGANAVTLAGRAVGKDGECFEDWQPSQDKNNIVCHAQSGPEPGDLVVVLPQDDASFAETFVYQERGKLLFSYNPRPPIPHKLYTLIHPFIRPTERNWLPDRWMHGALMVWK